MVSSLAKFVRESRMNPFWGGRGFTLINTDLMSLSLKLLFTLNNFNLFFQKISAKIPGDIKKSVIISG